MQPRDIFSSNHPLSQNTHTHAAHREVRFSLLNPSLLPYLVQARSFLLLQADDDKIERAMPEQSYGESFESSPGEPRVPAIRTRGYSLAIGRFRVIYLCHVAIRMAPFLPNKTKTPSLQHYRVAPFPNCAQVGTYTTFLAGAAHELCCRPPSVTQYFCMQG